MGTYFIATSWGSTAISQQFMTLSHELVVRGHRVVILVDGQKKDVEHHEGNPAIYTWPSKRPTHARDAIFLSRLLKHYRPDCLIANFGAANIMMLVGWLLRVPGRISWYHTLSTAIDLDAKLPRWKIRLLRLRKRLVYQATTHIVANSIAACDDAQRVFRVPRSKCQVFYNSLSDPLHKNEICEHIKREPGKILCVGRLYPTKGQDILIKALPYIAKTFPQLSVEFVGDGPSRSELVRLANELGVGHMCKFTDQIRHEEVLSKMATSEITIVPSRSDAFGLVNIESLAVGTPVIASAVGGIVEIVRDGVDGYMFPSEDSAALGSKICVLMSSPELKRVMGSNARENFLRNFETGVIVDNLIKWLERITSC